MMLKLKLQYFGHLMQSVDSLEKTVMLGGIGAGGEGDDRGWDGWMASPTWWMWVWVNSGSWWWTGRPGVLRFMGSQRVGHDWATELNFPSISVFSYELPLYIRLLKYWSLSFSISLSNEYSGLISIRIDRFDLLTVQETLKSLLQHHNSKLSVRQCSAFFIVQLSHP